MIKIDLYTDGACSGNPGDGGWACVLLYNEHKKELSGFEPNTTNNRMELTAVIKGLEALKKNAEVNIYSDSAYIVNAFLKDWISTWQNNNWKNSQNKKVLNDDLWKTLIKLTSKHKVNFIKVKGHSDNEYNNLCDKLAVDEIKKHQKQKNHVAVDEIKNIKNKTKNPNRVFSIYGICVCFHNKSKKL